MNQPPWMAFAWAELGEAEISGSDTNPRIAAYFRRAGHTEIRDDETPWCAAFVGACLDQASVAPSGSLAARSYLDWGTATDNPGSGAITVLSRGGDPALGHVAFLVGATETSVLLLGGNQSDSVSVAAFPRNRVVGFRVPSLEAVPDDAPTAAPSSLPVPVDGFEQALAHVLEFEGGWTDDPFDPGGPTNKGITLAVYARELGVTVDAQTITDLKARLAAIPDVEMARIYRERYWAPACCPDFPAALAFFHFDAAVNQGVGRATRLLQAALGVEVDGEIGPLTRSAATSQSLSAVLTRYAELRRRHYRSLAHFWRFGRGWLRRVDATLARAEALATLPSATQKKETPPMSNTNAAAQSATPETAADSKWWGSSLTIWGTLITAVSTVAPVLLSMLGVDLPASLIQTLGHDLITFAQAAGGLAGTAMTIAGRFRASTPLERRPLSLKV
jgi:uncharacterized protein (TIGR02594 family)